MKIIGIYPGRFQPAHRGHVGVYKRLKQIAGPDTFIATSDKTPTPDSPLNFGEKQQIWVRHGVPSSNVVRVKNVYSPEEITNNFMPETTAIIYALGSKDIIRFGTRKAKDPETGKEVWMKTDGKTPSYFQPYRGNEHDLQPLDKHGYVIIVDDIKIDGKSISGTNVREALSSPKYTPEQKKKFFQWAFGWYDPSLYQMLVDRFTDASKAAKSPSEKKPAKARAARSKPRTISKKTLQRVVAEILKEYSTPQGGTSTTTSTTDSSGDMSAAERSRQEAQSKADAVKAKQQAERDLKALDTDLKWKKSSVEKLRKDDLPNKRKELDQLNKVIAGTEPTSTAPVV